MNGRTFITIDAATDSFWNLEENRIRNVEKGVGTDGVGIDGICSDRDSTTMHEAMMKDIIETENFFSITRKVFGQMTAPPNISKP